IRMIRDCCHLLSDFCSKTLVHPNTLDFKAVTHPTKIYPVYCTIPFDFETMANNLNYFRR
ncbi:Hypothetical predicted protein, partial [Paramuricea clavata]